MNKDIQDMLAQLEEIREIYPDFGYSGRVEWIEEKEMKRLAEWDVGE